MTIIQHTLLTQAARPDSGEGFQIMYYQRIGQCVGIETLAIALPRNIVYAH